MDLPKKLQQKIAARVDQDSLRTLPDPQDKIDFSSNDYLGFSRNENIFKNAHQILIQNNFLQNGATGSRLLSGNHSLYPETELQIAQFHQSEAALIFNSGYNANIGFFSAVPQRGDLIFYDEWIHASIRDGVQMSLAKSYKFTHNDLEDLRLSIERNTAAKNENQEIYIVTESVFSMDGDTPDLLAFASFCKDNGYHLIVDEAHAVGVFGKKGVGLIQHLGLENQIFARIITFGKAMGCHGAAILGSEHLKNYLVNFARSFIYTTGLSPHAIATIQSAYTMLHSTVTIKKLTENIQFFNALLLKNHSQLKFIKSYSAIHCCLIPENQKVKKVASLLQEKGYEVKPILSPTVPKGEERLRFCLHSFNSKEEISDVLQFLAKFTAL